MNNRQKFCLELISRGDHKVCRFVILPSCIVTRNGQSGNTGRLNRNLYDLLKFTERPKTPGITSKKTLLVIFPMPGNNTFETSDFADLASLFEAARVSRTLPQCFYGKKLLKYETNVFVFSIQEFVFSRLLIVEKSKSKQLREETYWT